MTSCCGERPGETEGLAPKESSSFQIKKIFFSLFVLVHLGKVPKE